MKRRRTPPSHSHVKGRHRRGGYLYVAVMAVAMIVAIIGFSAMTLARMKLRDAQAGNDWHEARLLALSAVENAITVINNNSSWRTAYQNNAEYPDPIPLHRSGPRQLGRRR